MNRQLTQEEKQFSDAMLAELPPFVARERAGFYTGGLVAPKTLANADSKGEGPAGAREIGRKIAYPKQAFIEWIISRLGVRVAGADLTRRTPGRMKKKTTTSEA